MKGGPIASELEFYPLRQWELITGYVTKRIVSGRRVLQICASATDRYSPLCGRERSRKDAVPCGHLQATQPGRCAMSTFKIRYIFQFQEKIKETYDLILDAKSLDLVTDYRGELPTWTRLEFHQCPNCPLTSDQSPYCPLAEKLVGLISTSSRILSYDEVQVTVVTPERIIFKQTTAQQGFSSLMGLIMPTSGCPHTSYFKPMARFHLPFSSEEETIYRSASMYLLSQYFKWKNDEDVDYELDRLKEIYRNLHTVNMEFAERLRDEAEKDSSVNALVILDLFTKTLPYAIEDSMEELRYLFSPFLK